LGSKNPVCESGQAQQRRIHEAGVVPVIHETGVELSAFARVLVAGGLGWPGWLACLSDLLACAIWLASQLAGRLAGWAAGWLPACLAGWLAD